MKESSESRIVYYSKKESGCDSMENTLIPYTPIVMPRSKRYGNNYWGMMGPKVSYRDVILYSDLEYDHWVTVETDAKVKTYCEQPLEITYTLNGKRNRTIFDMCLYENGSELFVEVKYEKELHPSNRNYDRVMRQLEAQKEWCRLNGKLHEVRTEKAIRSGRYSIENRIKILASVINHRHPMFIEEVSKSLDCTKRTMKEICYELSDTCSSYEVFLSCHWLYYKGIITADIDSKIWNYEMEVWKLEQMSII